VSEIQPTEPIEPDALYTCAEVARLTKICLRTMRKLTRQGHIKTVRIGERMVRVRGADLIDYIEGGGSPQPLDAPPDNVRRRTTRRVA
jgi:excisionase family DNA binding protein